MKNILYISGWLGAGRNSGTFRWLETAYPDCNIDCIAPGGTIDLTEMRKEMEKKINELNPLIVANSFCCFLASFFPEKPAVWVNPCLYPSRTLPQIADLSDADMEMLRMQEGMRDSLYDGNHIADVLPVISDADELIPDHLEYEFTDKKPIIVPGGHHKLTDAQRAIYLKNAIDSQLQ